MTTQITVQDATNIVAVNIETSHTTNVVISRTAIGTMAHAETANTANTANYANFAGTAYSVAGANVSGYVANATHANVADSANSVAAGNISGTINFATYAGTANAVAGANVSGAVGLATYATTANAVAGANVSGTVANATYATTAGSATTAGTVTTNAQPNITSVGTLTGLTSSANISAPFFVGNVVGNISGNIVVPGSNTAVLFNNLGSAGASDALKFDYAANVLTVLGNISATNFSGSGAGLTSINGANVSEVANAGYATNSGHSVVADSANAVAGANVSGYVANANVANLATYATTANAYVPYSGSTSNVDLNNKALSNVSHIGINTSTIPTVLLRAIGNNTSQSRMSVRGYSSDANSSALRTTKFRGSAGAPQAPLSGDSLGKYEMAGYSTITSDGVVGAAVEGVATETWGFSGIGTKVLIKVTPNTTTTPVVAVTLNQDKSANFANTVTATGFYGPLSGEVTGNVSGSAGSANAVAGGNVSGAVANAAYATNSGHSVVADSANSVAAGNISGTINFATYAGTANAVAGANVSGTVANATYATTSGSAGSATTAGTVTTNAQPNITSVGTLSSLTVANTANVANLNVTGTGANGFITLKGQSSNPTAPAAGSVLLHATTLNGFTRLEQDNEAATNVVYGRDNAIVCRNDTGGTISKGQVVYTSGTVSNTPQITKAQSNASGTMPAIGIAADDILPASYGQVMTWGILSFNTTAFSDGNQVWVSPTTAGSLTSTRPSGANIVQRMGTILVSGIAGVGQMLVQTAPALLNIETGTNVTTWTANNVVANTFSGNVIRAAQGNITSLGNLTGLTINDANVLRPTITITPAGNSTGATLATNKLGLITVVDYGNINSAANPLNINFIKARGNATTPAPAANNDQSLRLGSYVYTGNGYAKATGMNHSAPLAANSIYTVTDSLWTPGLISFYTGHPFGNNLSTSSSAYNQFGLDQWAQIYTIAANNSGGSGGTLPGFSVIACGQLADGSGPGGQNRFQRSRGTSAVRTAVQTDDGVGSFEFQAYNGGDFNTGTPSKITAVVNTAHGAIAGGARVPIDIQVVTTSNTTSYTSTFYGNGTVQVPGVFYSSDADLGNLTTSNYFAGTLTTAAQPNITSVGNLTTLVIDSGGFVQYAAFVSTDLTAITGSVGQTAAVSDSAGMLAYWDTTNSRWSYVHDNSAV